MTNEKIEEVLQLYERKLEMVIIPDPGFSPKIAHAAVMIPKMREFLALGKLDKAFRWLGFLQGIFYTLNIYTIEEMASHNRTESDV